MTVLGSVRVSRGYDHCRHSHAGHCPRDVALGLTTVDLSRGATAAVAVAGAVGRFAEAARKVRPVSAGLRVTESPVERVGADVGRRLGEGRTFGARRRRSPGGCGRRRIGCG